MRKLFILVCTVLLSVNTWGQELPKIVPPSPEASAVFKFTEIPVSLYTGLPNIDIPLFIIESGGVTVPISISYHARGIQVAEIASRVGTGWTLNCGGMITKQVRDKDDELGYGGCVDYNTVFNSESSRNNTNLQQTGGFIETCDMIPDQYSFSVNGMSGKMIGGRYGDELTTQKYSNIKFSSNQIIDGNGNKYSFGENNASDHVWTSHSRTILHNTTVSSNEVTTSFPNTFHLTTIETAKGAIINFEYSNERTRYYTRSQDKFTEGIIQSHINYIVNDQKRIDRITFDKGEVLFEYSANNREDMSDASYLQKIILKDKSGQIVKQALFDYEYTTSNDEQNTNWFFTVDEVVRSAARKRLFLKSVQIADKDNITLPPYRFEYDDTILPSRHSNSVDLWGYYNGKNNGTFLERGIDDRTVDTAKVQAGMLKKIIKPEGGETNFHYEPNIAVNIFPPSVGFENPNPKIHKEITLSNLVATTEDYDTYIDKETGQPHYDGSGTYTDVFSISQFTIGSISYSASGSAIAGCPCTMVGCPQIVDPEATCLFHLYIDKWDLATGFVIHTPLFPGTRTLYLPPGVYRVRVQFKTGIHTPTAPNEFFLIYMSWYEQDSSAVPLELQHIELPHNCAIESITGKKIIHAAGNRVKKIVYKDSAGNIELTKTYRYVDPITQVPSGRVLGLTNMADVTYFDINGIPVTYYNQASSIASLFSTYQSNAVGYKYVTEYYGDGDNTIGKTEYAYSMIYDTGGYYEFPQHPPTDNEWLRGKELSVIHYKKSGDNYQIIQKTENTYLLVDELQYTGQESLCDLPFLKPSVILEMPENFSPNGGYEYTRRKFSIPLVIIPIAADPDDEDEILRYKTYYMTGGTMDLKRTKTTDYFENGNELVTTTEYDYKYDNHYNPSVITQSTSDGIFNSTKYFYAKDPEMNSKPFRLELGDKNILDVPLVTQSFKGGDKLSEQETEFNNWTINSTNFLAPKFIHSAKGEQNTEVKVIFNEMDEKGNTLEVQQENGIKICYIYAYNQALPVAKIENISYNQIPPNVIEAIHNSTDVPSVYDESLVLTALNNLRVSLAAFADCMITTLTYKPLVGVSTITDSKEQRTTYEYDSFGRLKFVIDHQGNILSENEYVYRTQN